MKKFLSANEAVAHAAAQAGCVVASAYPGTPSTGTVRRRTSPATARSRWSRTGSSVLRTVRTPAVCDIIPEHFKEYGR